MLGFPAWHWVKKDNKNKGVDKEEAHWGNIVPSQFPDLSRIEKYETLSDQAAAKEHNEVWQLLYRWVGQNPS